ncbi:DUF1707 SHOCT-like domain-containing protein [Amycolatopsis sp. CA-230715]|uniref:DUF1707 SHOCT-like domain-containing protein n=1 Tax=Amycolatopsis sp. CA-230715 TaxID=2745196 RepID=UPI001C0150DC|nr:DUF1707 domain-containing protein [Amycolatopsis sp. CA-230715]QWF79409.1 hypothetical protein HUW46_02817 [Amycolatopsis sp. CA-230715]
MRASNADRERFAQILHNALGEGRITVEELEERLDTVYAAKTLKDLEPVVADLPGVTATPGGAIQPAQTQAVAGPDSRIGGTAGSQMSFAFMSGASRKGSWVVPPQHTSVAFWGGVDIDLRNARFAVKNSTITAVAVMGGIDIVVPDDIVVDVSGIGIMGGFELNDRSERPAPPAGAPVVKINGFAFWGGVTVIRKPRDKPTKQIEE